MRGPRSFAGCAGGGGLIDVDVSAQRLSHPEDAHQRRECRRVVGRQRGSASESFDEGVDKSALARAEQRLVGEASHHAGEVGSRFVLRRGTSIRSAILGGLIGAKRVDILLKQHALRQPA